LQPRTRALCAPDPLELARPAAVGCSNTALLLDKLVHVVHLLRALEEVRESHEEGTGKEGDHWRR